MPAQLENPPEKLTLEQQKALAEVELARFHKNERLHQLARGYTGRRWLSLAFFLLGLWVAGKSIEVVYYGVAFSLLALVIVLVQIHTAGINRRLDALLELLDSDQSASDKHDNS
jgi:membrane protein required for beta-lactamase induction